MSTQRITKELAELTANNMLDQVDKRIDEKKKELNSYAEKLVKGSIPINIWILITSEELNEYIKKESYFYFRDNDNKCNCKKLSIGSYIPYKTNTNNVYISTDEYNKLESLTNQVDKAKEEKSILKKQIIATLLKLNTVNKVKNEFPEAYNKMPKDKVRTGGEIALPIQDILTNIFKLSN